MTMGRTGSRALSLRHSVCFSSCTGSAAISATRAASSRTIDTSVCRDKLISSLAHPALELDVKMISRSGLRVYRSPVIRENSIPVDIIDVFGLC